MCFQSQVNIPLYPIQDNGIWHISGILANLVWSGGGQKLNFIHNRLQNQNQNQKYI